MSIMKGTMLSFALAQTSPGAQLPLAYPVRVAIVHRQKPEKEPVSAMSTAPASSPAARPPMNRADPRTRLSRGSK